MWLPGVAPWDKLSTKSVSLSTVKVLTFPGWRAASRNGAAVCFWDLQSCLEAKQVSGEMCCVPTLQNPFVTFLWVLFGRLLWNGHTVVEFMYECVKDTWQRGRAQRDLDEKQREVSQSSPLLHGAYFQTALSINFMLLLFQKLYKYAEQSDDKIPIPGIAR